MTTHARIVPAAQCRAIALQFVWDLSFAATAMSLLDPTAMRDTTAFVMSASTGLRGPPPAVVPQTWVRAVVVINSVQRARM